MRKPAKVERRGRRDEAFRNKAKSPLSIPQVRMILRIYWSDQYLQRARGMNGTKGVQHRLAKQFGVSVEVIKKITRLKHNKRRVRFTSILIPSIQRRVRERLTKLYGAENVSIRKPPPVRQRKAAAAALVQQAGDGGGRLSPVGTAG